MIKLVKDKKKSVLLFGLLLIILGVGATYAWWTASKTTTQTIAMGKLRIDVSAETLAEGHYEPDTYAEYHGVVKNTGSLATLIKIESASQIKFKYADDELTELGVTEYQEMPLGAVGLTFEPKSGKYDDLEGAFWFHKKGSPNERYLLLDPNIALNITNIASFSGQVMTNKYQESEIKVIGTFKATQVLEGALQAEFGIGFEDLKGLSDTDTLRGTGLNRADRKLMTLLNRH